MNIAVRTPNWLGDAIMALPALGDVAATFPDDSIHVFAAGPARAVMAHTPFPFERHGLDRASGRVQMFRGALDVLRARRYELGIVLPPSLSSALLFRLGGVRYRVGYRGHGRSRLLTHPVEDIPRGEVHLSREYRSLVAEAARAVGRTPRVGDGAARLVPTEAAREDARARIADGEGPLVVIAPGAVYGPTKRWPAPHFAALADRLCDEHGARVVLTGASLDVPVCREVASLARRPVTDLSGETSLPTLVAVLERASLVVSNDSGAMHLAAAARAPVVAIFGSTNPGWTAPLGDRVRVIWRHESCAPCYRRRCPIGEVCLTRISCDEVLDACRDMLTGQVVR